jgi:hypothetical protein
MSCLLKAKRLLINKVLSARQEEKKCSQTIGSSAATPRRRKRSGTRIPAYTRTTVGRRLAAFGGILEFSNIEYEGKSHDVVDNKAPIFLSHDVYDK